MSRPLLSRSVAGPLIALAAVLCVAAPSVRADQPPVRVKVFCFSRPDPTGFIDQAARDRDDSVEDLRRAIAKKDWLQVADRIEEASITLEVVDRTITRSKDSDTTSSGYVDKKGNVHTNTHTQTYEDYTLRAMMHVGEYQSELTGVTSSRYIGGLWRNSASLVASQVEKFVKANYSRLWQDGRLRAPSPASAYSTPAARTETMEPASAFPPPPPASPAPRSVPRPAAGNSRDAAGLSAQAEGTVVEGLRHIALAEDSIGEVNGGFYVPLACVSTPSSCLSTSNAASLSDNTFAAAIESNGYKVTFYPGPAAAAADVASAKASKQSLLRWALVAAPASTAGTGARSFCVDDTSRVRVLPLGVSPRLGRCPAFAEEYAPR